jgi:hypothetical protein
MSSQTIRLILFTNLLLVGALYAPAVLGQTAQPSPTPLTAPPPRKTILKDERSRIEQTSDSKQRLRLTLELANIHLGLAEKYTGEANYEAAQVEVGIYHGLIENALLFLSPLKRDSNKTRDLYKRLELSLRGDGPRLTAMRRTTPLEFAVWIKKVEDFARDGRTEALNSFYGHTVVREPQKANQDKPDDKPKESPTPKSDEP